MILVPLTLTALEDYFKLERQKAGSSLLGIKDLSALIGHALVMSKNTQGDGEARVIQSICYDSLSTRLTMGHPMLYKTEVVISDTNQSNKYYILLPDRSN